MGKTLFALLHLGLLLGLLGYAAALIVRGGTDRGLTILGLLGLYYALVLHKAVLAEIKRIRDRKRDTERRRLG